MTVTYISLTYQRQQTSAGSTHKRSLRPSSSLLWGWELRPTSKTHTIHCCRQLLTVRQVGAPTEPSAPRTSSSTFCHSLPSLYVVNECVSAGVLVHVYAHQSTRKLKSSMKLYCFSTFTFHGRLVLYVALVGQSMHVTENFSASLRQFSAIPRTALTTNPTRYWGLLKIRSHNEWLAAFDRSYN